MPSSFAALHEETRPLRLLRQEHGSAAEQVVPAAPEPCRHTRASARLKHLAGLLSGLLAPSPDHDWSRDLQPDELAG